mmetsp:Transcript_40458/g.38954  ORF Transcript_40458/g.38954 Transcript_40458/m.38954 type:complete len:232 (+) Transcript_40458:145-840(+)
MLVLKSTTVKCSSFHSFSEMDSSPLFLRSIEEPWMNSLRRLSQISNWPLAPGMFLMTACFCSSCWTSPSSILFLRYFFSWSAPAFLIDDFIAFNEFPSMFILTRFGIKAIFGLMSERSLLETLRVLRFLRSKIVSGKCSNLLLWRSNTHRLAAFSRFSIFSRKLKARLMVSSFLALGMELKEVNWLEWRSSMTRLRRLARASCSTVWSLFLARFRSERVVKLEKHADTTCI